MKKITLAIFSTLLILMMVSTVYATWYTMNQDPHFNNSAYWGLSLWDESGSATHTYAFTGSKITTGLDISGFNDWGNTEYEQGTDPWGSYGYGLAYDVPATASQRLITYSIVTDGSANYLYGRMNKYVEFWLTNGTNWAEAMVIFDSDGVIMPCNAGQNQYWSGYAEGGWYFVGYRHWNQNFNQWTYRETNLNSIFNLLESEFDLDLDNWYVKCICVGVEGTSGEMIAQWDYVYYDIGM